VVRRVDYGLRGGSFVSIAFHRSDSAPIASPLDRHLGVAVVGAGSYGTLIAAALAHAGHRVLLIDVLPARLQPLRERGVHVTAPDARYHAQPETALAHCAAGTFDVAFLDTPTGAAPPACRVLERILAPEGVAVTLQHGLLAERVAGLLGRHRTVVACAGFDVTASSATDVAFGAGRFVLGSVAAEAAAHHGMIAALLAGAGFASVTLPDVRAHLWSATVVTALALARSGRGDAAEFRAAAVAREIAALAAAYGVEVEAKEGVDLTLFAPDRPSEPSLQALRAWRAPTPDAERPAWRRRLEGLAPASILADRIGFPLPMTRSLVGAARTARERSLTAVG
jgi:2-dehydropantoate 2-reductase